MNWTASISPVVAGWPRTGNGGSTSIRDFRSLLVNVGFVDPVPPARSERALDDASLTAADRWGETVKIDAGLNHRKVGMGQGTGPVRPVSANCSRDR